MSREWILTAKLPNDNKWESKNGFLHQNTEFWSRTKFAYEQDVLNKPHDSENMVDSKPGLLQITLQKCISYSITISINITMI